MAITLRSADRFPVGTSVSAYRQTNLPLGTGAPPGAVAETKTVQSDGTLTFTTLLEDTSYIAYANVGGQDVYVGFRVDELTGAASTPGLPTGGTTGQVLTKSSSISGDAGWATPATGGSFIDVTQTPYFADKTGATDATAAIQAAVTAAVNASGGVVYLPAGTYLLAQAGVNSIVFPPGDHGQVTIRGDGKFATTIKLSTTTRSFILAGPTSGLGTMYKNLTVEDLTVDNNNVAASGSRFGVIFGVGLHTSLENIAIRRVDTINLGNAAAGRRSVDMIVVANQMDAADTYTIKNILIEDCDLGRSGGGGATGVTVSGFEGGTSPGNAQLRNGVYRVYVYLDNIIYRRCSWKGGSTVGVLTFQVGFIAGGDGYGDRLRIEDCYVQDSADDAIEVGSFYDVDIRNCVLQDCWSEHLYFRNMGGLAHPSKQKVRVTGCRFICTYRSAFGVFIHSTDGIPLGHFAIKDCQFITDGSPLATTGVPTIPTVISARGAFRSLTVENCDMIVRNFTRTWTANSQSFSTIGIDVRHEGLRGKLTVRNFGMDIEGVSDNTGAFTSIQLQSYGVLLDGLSDMEMLIDGLTMRNLIQKVGTAHFVQTYMMNIGSGNVVGVQDTFATDRLSKDYVLDAGALSDVSVTGGALTSVANHGAEKRLRFFGNNANLYVSSYGPATDQAAWAQFTYSQTAGHKGGVTLKATAADTYLDAYITDDGTNSILNLDKVSGGVRTNLATTTLGSRLADAATYYVRGKIQGDAVTVDHFTSAPSTTSVSTAGAATLGPTTLAGSDVATFGSNAQGYIGLAWIPAVSTATVDNLTHVPMGVLHGTCRRIVPQEVHGSQSGASGIIFNADNTKLRITDLTFEDCNWKGGAGPGITEFVSMTGATGHGQVVNRVRNVYNTVPAAAAITVTASPFAFTNADGLMEDVSVYGGTVSSIAVTRKGGASSQVASATGQTVRLAPGDVITVTYSVAPTMRKTPVS